MDWPPLGVLIVTWNRPNEIRLTIKALRTHLKYHGRLQWHLADDNTGGDYIEQLHKDFPQCSFTSTVTDRKGWGANVNMGLRFLKNLPFVFLCEDDYVATRDIDLTRGVALMLADKKIGLVRYDGIAAHGERGMELLLRSAGPKGKGNRIPHLIISKKSAHLNIYSHRPHLKHSSFHAAYGLYPIGIPLAQTEQGFATKVKTSSGPEIAILPDYLFTPFHHIGKSWQKSVSDVGKTAVHKPRHHGTQLKQRRHKRR